MERFISNIPAALAHCAAYLRGAGKISLEEQARAYDLLDAIIADSSKTYRDASDFAASAQAFKEALKDCAVEYDEPALKAELAQKMEPLDNALNEARFKAAAAASLHEFTKEVYEIWQTSGIFARRRALKELRERAGFRLEAHRIGNYVAKTFDLMNEAQTEFARAQQARFSADITYKIKPDIFKEISKAL